MRIDLHTHSSASDGTDTPAELVRAARAAGLDVVALTDHDTTAGWDEAMEAAPAGLTVVRGMEMSCTGRGEDGDPVPVHLLAYLFDPENEAFALERARLREERSTRIRRMAELLAVDYPSIDPEDILARTGPSAGRPHLARALVDAGAVPSVQAAFDGPLSTGSLYYVPKVDTPLDRAVKMIAAAGGVSVLAHARARTRGRLLDLAQIRELVSLEPGGTGGLGGIEVDHADHNAEDARVLRELAGELDLIVTGSSDYHGRNKELKLGRHLTSVNDYERLVSQASGLSV
ncbi:MULTISPECIES: PHP domain-containing protein [unclassified Rhodococcus (in: high G+C Gram-positive bacteria)]|uniref:PHP domain-containing protein n=1 Tax=unclassified Rhodococcus (in: high G+C Gram-positive bacteria) TaxID=192944 RepID=UPI003392DB9A